MDTPATDALLTALRDSMLRLGIRQTSLIVGVSGGADSVALLSGLAELRSEFEIRPIIGHLNHQLRPSADKESMWVCQLGKQLDLPVITEAIDIYRRAEQSQRGLEETARNVRRDFLTRIARDRQARIVTVAHTADDQVETILHHLLRGTGLAGLAGMSATQPLGDECTLWRPLLSITRQQVEAYLRNLDLPWLTDESNLDPRFTRNRIRHQLLPHLREQFNPQVDQALLRIAEISNETQQFVSTLAIRMLDELQMSSTENSVQFHREKLIGTSPLVIREMCVEIWRRQHWPRQSMSQKHWQWLADLVIHTSPHSSLSLPHGLQATRRRNTVRIERPNI
ncbi:MAG: tRNA lysidine(34) synthetase TilS [Planctomycetaceae bacterium]